MASTWEITINGWEGLVPAFWEDDFPTFGNKGHASAMQHIDLINPNVLKPGPGLADLTGVAAVTTLIKGMQQLSSDGTYAYGTGGAKVYQFTGSAVTADANWPHTIDKAAVTSEDGEDVVKYGANTFYSYNHSGTAGDIGRWTGSAFDDDYMSTVPSGGAALTGGVPHPMVVGGNDVLYIANGNKVSSFNGTTFVTTALDLPVGEVITDLDWEHNRLYIGVNRPNTSGVFNQASVYIWDTTSTSWEYQIKVIGRIGAVHAKNGTVLVFYHDQSSDGGYKMAAVAQSTLQDIVQFTDGLPGFHQVTEHKNHILFVAGSKTWAFGAASNNLPTKLFQLSAAGASGGITNAFGTPIVAVSSSSLAKFTNYETDSQWKSILFDVASATTRSVLDRVVIFTDPLAEGAELDVTLKADYGNITKTLGSVAYSGDGPNIKHVVLRDGIELSNFRLDLDWSDGSATNPVKVRKIVCTGTFIEHQ